MSDNKDRELTVQEMKEVNGGTILPTRRTPPVRGGASDQGDQYSLDVNQPSKES